MAGNDWSKEKRFFRSDLTVGKDTQLPTIVYSRSCTKTNL